MNFFSKMRITHKISAFMFALALGFIFIGITFYFQINTSENTRQNEKSASKLQQEALTLETHLLGLQLATVNTTNGSARVEVDTYYEVFNQSLANINALTSNAKIISLSNEIASKIADHEKKLNQKFNSLNSAPRPFSSSANIDNEISSQALQETRQLDQDLITLYRSISDLIDTLKSSTDNELSTTTKQSEKADQISQAAMTAVIFFVAMGAAIGIYLIYKSIVFPITHMQSVIRRINKGKTKARVKILSNDELADLGKAFNTLFDERIEQLETQSRENEHLNNSIIALIQALGTIARKDLTVKVPVSADITGTISDAVNLLSSETASTLHKVKSISIKVNDAADHLQAQSQKVSQFAESERLQIIATSKALRILASAMASIAEDSEHADRSANVAIENTHTANTSVTETVNGILSIRETLSETEKRTKRLSDRSQEISGIISLINTIAERTHILALNASMHAASAGAAGKGFAVVAEEVQRLAESARQSTSDIASMVNNIRAETADTLTIINKLITQVAEGSKTAERAGREMRLAEQATKELVTTVKRISNQAIQQAAVANKVKDRVAIIRNFTDKTEKQLQEQKVYTDNLSHYANSLVTQVSIFKLPTDLDTEQSPSPKVEQPSLSAKVSPIKSAV